MVKTYIEVLETKLIGKQFYFMVYLNVDFFHGKLILRSNKIDFNFDVSNL